MSIEREGCMASASDIGDDGGGDDGGGDDGGGDDGGASGDDGGGVLVELTATEKMDVNNKCQWVVCAGGGVRTARSGCFKFDTLDLPPKHDGVTRNHLDLPPNDGVTMGYRGMLPPFSTEIPRGNGVSYPIPIQILYHSV